jgi:4-hydroxy-2-oxoheptanedioate aldolase
MKANPLKSIWAQGKPVLHGWLSIGNPFVAEIMAAQGFDAISVDLQHGALDYSDALPMFQAMRASGVVIGARVPWLDPAMIMKALDAGATQIICPMVNTPEQAAEFVSHLRYPPLGQRSFGPTRAQYALGGNIAAESNDAVIAWAMVETREAFDNIEAIAATAGLDGIYVGPADLTFSLLQGELTPAMDPQDERIVSAIKRIAQVCKAAGIKCALHCGTPEYAARAVGWGYDMTTVGADFKFMAAAASQAVQQFRALTETSPQEGGSGAGQY